MSAAEFARIRSLLGKSQRELAILLGLSLKAIESYEQGWRKIPAQAERILYFLLFKLDEKGSGHGSQCWETKACPEERRNACVAWIAKEGRFCWFFTGRLCASPREGGSGASRDEGVAAGCYSCRIFADMKEKAEGRGFPEVPATEAKE